MSPECKCSQLNAAYCCVSKSVVFNTVYFCKLNMLAPVLDWAHSYSDPRGVYVKWSTYSPPTAYQWMKSEDRQAHISDGQHLDAIFSVSCLPCFSVSSSDGQHLEAVWTEFSCHSIIHLNEQWFQLRVNLRQVRFIHTLCRVNISCIIH